MPLYRYEAVAATGELVSGEMDAPDQTTVVTHLQSAGHTPISADLAGSGQRFSGWARSLVRHRQRPLKELGLLTQQLATLLQACLSLDRALETARTTSKAAEQSVLNAVLDRIRGGSALADSLAAQTPAFPKFYVSMVRAGEASGSLDTTLRELGDYLERARAAREQVKSALIYPSLVLATGLISVAFLFSFVVPRFRPLFADAGTSLPLSAQAVLAVADLFENNWWVLAAGAFTAAALVASLWRNPRMRAAWDERVLRLPPIGDVILKAELARFSRTLGTLLKSGVAPLSALSMSTETLRNTAIRTAISGLADGVKQGKGLAQPLSQLAIMPPLAVQLIRVGEETARLEEMLLKLAGIYDQEVRREIERLLALLVPGITIALGVLVAVVIGSILTAVLSIYELAI